MAPILRHVKSGQRFETHVNHNRALPGLKTDKRMHVGLLSSLQMHDYALNWTTHTTSYALNICYAYRPTEQKKNGTWYTMPEIPAQFSVIRQIMF